MLQPQPYFLSDANECHCHDVIISFPYAHIFMFELHGIFLMLLIFMH